MLHAVDITSIIIGIPVLIVAVAMVAAVVKGIAEYLGELSRKDRM